MRFSSVIQCQDLRPVGILRAGRFVVHGGDGGLDLVCANRTFRKRGGDERDAFGDLRAIPQTPVLFGERDQLAAGSGSRRAARIGQQHERQQSRDFAIVRQQVVNRPRQADRFAG